MYKNLSIYHIISINQLIEIYQKYHEMELSIYQYGINWWMMNKWLMNCYHQIISKHQFIKLSIYKIKSIYRKIQINENINKSEYMYESI